MYFTFTTIRAVIILEWEVVDKYNRQGLLHSDCTAQDGSTKKV